MALVNRNHQPKGERRSNERLKDSIQTRRNSGSRNRMRQLRSSGSVGVALSRKQSPAWVLAVVGFVEFRFHPLLTPDLLARPPWVFLKMVVPFGKIPVYCCFGILD